MSVVLSIADAHKDKGDEAMYEDTILLDATTPLQTEEAWQQLDYFSPTERGELFRWLNDIQEVELAATRVRSARQLVSMDRG